MSTKELFNLQTFIFEAPLILKSAKMKKLLIFNLILSFIFTASLQAQNLEPTLFDLFARKRISTVVPPKVNINIVLGIKSLACGDWEACREDKKISSNSVVSLGVDIFLPNSYWSIPVDILNAKSGNHKIELLKFLALETLELSTGIRRHHLIRNAKYNAIDYYYGLGLMLSKSYYYSGVFQPGLSLLQDQLCKTSVYCAKGSGIGYYIDLGIQYSIRSRFFIGTHFKKSTANYTLKNPDKSLSPESIKADFGGSSIGLSVGLNF